MQLAITNLSSSKKLELTYLEKVIQPGATITFECAQYELSKMVDLQAAVASGAASYQVIPNSMEAASGVLTAGIPLATPTTPGLQPVGSMLDFSDGSIVFTAPSPRSGLAERRFSTFATLLYLTAQMDASGGYGITSNNEVAYSTDGGATWSYITYAGEPANAGSRYEKTVTVALAAGQKDIIIRNSGANASTGYPNSLSPAAYFTSVQANDKILVQRRTTRADHVVLVGDSILCDGTGATHPTTDGIIPLLLKNHPEIGVSSVGGGGLSLWQQNNVDPGFVRLARLIAAECVGTKRNRIVITLGTNDYAQSGATSESTANFTTYCDTLLTAIEVAAPDAECICVTPLLRGVEGTLGDWRTAEITAITLHTRVRRVNGDTQMPLTAWADGVHPNTAQYANLYLYLESILGLWDLSKVTGVNAGWSVVAAWKFDSLNNALSGNDLVEVADNGPNRKYGLKQFVTATATTTPRLTTRRSSSDIVANGTPHATGLAAQKSAMACKAFDSPLLIYTILAICRFDGAASGYQFLLSSLAANSCSFSRDPSGAINFTNDGSTILQVSATTPAGIAIYEINKWHVVGGINLGGSSVNGAAFIKGNVGINDLDGIIVNSNSALSFPGNVSHFELVILSQPTPSPGDVNYTWLSAASRARLGKHLTAIGVTSHGYA